MKTIDFNSFRLIAYIDSVLSVRLLIVLRVKEQVLLQLQFSNRKINHNAEENPFSTNRAFV